MEDWKVFPSSHQKPYPEIDRAGVGLFWNHFGTDFSNQEPILELHRAGSRYEPTQGFELTPRTLDPVLKYFRDFRAARKAAERHQHSSWHARNMVTDKEAEE